MKIIEVLLLTSCLANLIYFMNTLVCVYYVVRCSAFSSFYSYELESESSCLKYYSLVYLFGLVLGYNYYDFSEPIWIIVFWIIVYCFVPMASIYMSVVIIYRFVIGIINKVPIIEFSICFKYISYLYVLLSLMMVSVEFFIEF